MHDFQLAEDCIQLVSEFTRTELVGGVVQKSCIDHLYTNHESKISSLKVLPIGDSDHFRILAVKTSKHLLQKETIIKKRIYKNFDTRAFLQDIYEANINTKVLEENTIEKASQKFQDCFLPILNKHAPLSTIQIRNNYCPFISI